MDQLIASHDIISFDMFDTLVSRPFARPEDLQEYTHGIKYRRQRVGSKIPPTQQEIQAEINLCYPILKMQRLFNKALSLNKQIIIVSDMYLSSKTLHTILTKCGYNIPLTSIFVSCEHNDCKCNTLFTKIQSLFPNKSILHFDDNQLVINRIKHNYAITPVKVNSPLQDLFLLRPRLRFLSQDTLALRHYLGWLAKYYATHNSSSSNSSSPYFFHLGLCLGVLAYGFAQFVNTQAHALKIKTLLFLSRDMYPVHKFYNRLPNTIRNHYALNSRRLYLNTQSRPSPTATPRPSYDFYYNSLTTHKPFAIVDTITGWYTAQKLIRADYQIYETVDNTNLNPTPSRAPITWGTTRNRLRPNPLLETIWTEPVPSLIDILPPSPSNPSPTPVRKQENGKDYTLTSILVNAELEFNPLPNINFTFDDCKAIWTNYVQSMTNEDKIELNKLYFYHDPNHEITRELFINEDEGI